MNKFTEISPFEISGNPIYEIGRDWMLVSAADNTNDIKCGRNYNMMTASWGSVGVMWGSPVAFVFIRPERHTFGFIENSLYMSLSFFSGERRDTLNLCGKKSGRDIDKAEECSLTPVFDSYENGDRSVYFEEASKVFILRKLYSSPLDTEAFVDKSCLDFYKKDGVHKMFVCEISKALIKK